MMKDGVTELDGLNFDTVVTESEKPVIVDFWATWCGPCRMVSPIIDELADDYKDQIVVGKVNVDDNGDIAQEYGIISIPTILFFKEGEIVDKVVGARSKEDYVRKIQDLL